jgi:site-specific DNA recombinase
MTECVGYIRVSTPRQAKEGESLDTQRNQIQQFAKAKGWDLIRIYEDRGISGSKAEARTDFIRLMADSKHEEFDRVIITRFSRFARNAREYLNYFDELKNNGAIMFSIKESVDPTTIFGKMAMGIMAHIAEWELENIRETMAENKMTRWEDRKIFNGQPPCGYRWNKEKKVLEIVSEEAKVYQRIVAMYVDKGMSFKDIALKLRDEGTKSRRAWFTKSALSYILKNPAYYGHYVVNKYKYTGPGGRKRTKEEKPPREHIDFPIPPLITKNRWDQVQERTAFNKTKSKRGTVSLDYFLRDILICGECGGRVKPHHGATRKDGTFPRYYSCYWADANDGTLKLHDRKKCCLPLIRAESLEAEIWIPLTLLFGLDGKSFFGPWIDASIYDKQMESLEAQALNIKGELEKQRRGKKRLFEAYEDGEVNLDDLKQRLRVKEDEIFAGQARLAEVNEQIGNLREAKKKDSLRRDLVNNKARAMSRLREYLLDLPPGDKKDLVEGIVDGMIPMLRDKKKGKKGWKVGGYGLKFNPAILEDIIERFELGKLGINTHDNFAGYEFRGEPGDDENP